MPSRGRINRNMCLVGPDNQEILSELAVINRMLPLADASVLELGCGGAEKTRAIAERTDVASITAVEIDKTQHQKNLEITDLPKVRFQSFGAEDIQAENNSYDIVMMFKSLHHVPANDLDAALKEIYRVLKPGGYSYISEPVFAGAYNEIMRLFHDEEIVRKQAFEAVKKIVDSGVFKLAEEFFFKNKLRLRSFEQYETGILGVTHTNHQINDETMNSIKKLFLSNESDEGFVFEIPNRIDLLRKPS